MHVTLFPKRFLCLRSHDSSVEVQIIDGGALMHLLNGCDQKVRPKKYAKHDVSKTPPITESNGNLWVNPMTT